MEPKVKHRSENDVIAALEQAASICANLEALIDDETSNPRIASAREKNLYAQVANSFRIVAVKYEIMNSIRFADRVEFI